MAYDIVVQIHIVKTVSTEMCVHIEHHQGGNPNSWITQLGQTCGNFCFISCVCCGMFFLFSEDTSLPLP